MDATSTPRPNRVRGSLAFKVSSATVRVTALIALFALMNLGIGIPTASADPSGIEGALTAGSRTLTLQLAQLSITFGP